MSTNYKIEMVEATYWMTGIKVTKSMHLETHLYNAITLDFGGDAMWQWKLCSWGDKSDDHIRNHASCICWAEWLFNGLSEESSSQLEVDNDPIVIDEDHPDYAFVARIFELKELDSDSKVFELCGAHI